MGRVFHSHPLSKPQDGPVSRYLNRWISYSISRLLLKTSLMPNQISIAISLLAVPIMITGIYGYLFVVGLLMQVSSIIRWC